MTPSSPLFTLLTSIHGVSLLWLSKHPWSPLASLRLLHPHPLRAAVLLAGTAAVVFWSNHLSLQPGSQAAPFQNTNLILFQLFRNLFKGSLCTLGLNPSFLKWPMSLHDPVPTHLSSLISHYPPFHMEWSTPMQHAWSSGPSSHTHAHVEAFRLDCELGPVTLLLNRIW